MKIVFFTVPVFDSGEAADELNRFLGTHRISDVQQKFIDNGANSAWAFTVSYAAVADQGSSDAGARKNRIDYREVLGEDDFTAYLKLRELRKQISDETGVPVYGIFSNEHLADMVRKRPASLTALAELDRVGAKKVERYGTRFLQLLASLSALVNETASDSD